jgi:hypothetical protein
LRKGYCNTAIGQDAGYGITDEYNNTCIGDHTMAYGGGSGNIMLGYNAGYYETGSNKLYIENSTSTTPLIWGDFSTDDIKINGDFTVTGTAFSPAANIGSADMPTQELSVIGDLSVSDTSFLHNVSVDNALSIEGATLMNDELNVNATIDANYVVTGDLHIDVGETNKIRYATDGVDGTLFFYNEYDNEYTVSIDEYGDLNCISGDLKCNYDVEINGDLTVKGEDLNLTGNAPYIRYGDASNDGVLAFYSAKDNFPVMTVNSDSTVSVNGGLIVSGETSLRSNVEIDGTTVMNNGLTMGGAVGDFNYAINRSAYVDTATVNKVSSDEYNIYIIDPDANITFTISSAVEEVGREITIINNNADKSNHSISLSLGYTVKALESMNGYAYKSMTMVYSGTKWFITAVWNQPE